MKINSRPIISILLAMLSGACSEISSKDLKTSGIYTETSITAKDDSTIVFVRMRTGRALDADGIILSYGDRLSATKSGNTVGLMRTDSNAYKAVLPASASGAVVKVSLSRSEGLDASNSIVSVPGPFEITAPSAGETFDSDQNITVVWSPAEPGDTAIVSYKLDCPAYQTGGLPSGISFIQGYTVADSGIYTASVREILNTLGTQEELVEGVPCQFEIGVSRTATGSLDPALTKGGKISALREKKVVVSVEP